MKNYQLVTATLLRSISPLITLRNQPPDAEFQNIVFQNKIFDS